MARIQATLDPAIRAAKDVAKQVDDAMKALSTPRDLEISGIVELIKQKKLKSVQDVGQLFQVYRQLPRFLKAINVGFPPIRAAAKKVEDLIQDEMIDKNNGKLGEISIKCAEVRKTLDGLGSDGFEVVPEIKVASYGRRASLKVVGSAVGNLLTFPNHHIPYVEFRAKKNNNNKRDGPVPPENAIFKTRKRLAKVNRSRIH